MDKKSKEQAMEELSKRYAFRNIKPEEADQAVHMEQVCVPPNEACRGLEAEALYGWGLAIK